MSESTSPAARDQNLTAMLPFLIGVATNMTSLSHLEQVVIVNHVARTMILLEGAELDSLLRELSQKSGPKPATKDSIEAMPRVAVTEAGLDCTICLANFEVGVEAREMPCNHRFHSGCIEKWLRINGSCPVCRFAMPVDDEHSGGGGGGGEGRALARERVVFVNVWTSEGRGTGPGSGTVGGSAHGNSDPEEGDGGGVESVDSSSTQ